MTTNRERRRLADDANFITLPDGTRIVRDGGRVRVPMQMMDSMQRQVALVTDGTTDPHALHRPGMRLMDGADRSAGAKARYLQMMQDSEAWRQQPGQVWHDADPDDGDGESDDDDDDDLPGFRHTVQRGANGAIRSTFESDAAAGAYPLTAGEGNPCTFNGAPGHLERVGDVLLCRVGGNDSARAPRQAARAVSSHDGTDAAPRTMSAEDAQAIRDEAWETYAEEQRNAWRTL